MRTLDFGPWTLDLGLWTLDFGLWTLDFGFWIFVRSAEPMDSLVLALLAYARVARSEIPLGAAHVRTAWAAALAQHEQAIAEKKPRVQTAPPLPQVRAHESTLAQA